MPPESGDIEVGLLRGRVAHTAIALGPPVGVVALAIASGIVFSPVFLAAMPLCMIFAIFFTMWAIGRPRPVERTGALRVRGDAIWIGDQPLIPHEFVKEGSIVPYSPEGTIVRLVTRTGVVSLQTKTLQQARAALEILGLDAAHHAASFTIRARKRGTFMRRFLISLGMFLAYVFGMAIFGAATHSPAAVALIPFASIALALSIALPTKVTVGTDGLVLNRLFSRREFVSLEGIEKAVVVEGELSMNTTPIYVQLRGALGEIKDELFVDARKEGPFQDAVHAALMARADGLAERINEAIEARKQAKSVDPAALARGGRNSRVWVDELRTLLSRAETFRASPLSVEALTAIVEDASATPVTRAAAAAALSTSNADVRARVRIAAEATAAPHLRVALEAASAGDPERIADAIEEIEAAERR